MDIFNKNTSSDPLLIREAGEGIRVLNEISDGQFLLIAHRFRKISTVLV